MPKFLSEPAKDLINRMLQPHPLKRITIAEIKKHPWFSLNAPLYLNSLTLHSKSEQEQEPDKEIIDHLFQVESPFGYTPIARSRPWGTRP